MMGQVVDTAFFGLLTIGPFCVPPIMIWGWYRWWRGRTTKTAGQLVSLTGFLLSTVSVLLAVALYLLPSAAGSSDQASEFISFLGMRVALAGIPFSIVGTGWPGPLRWHALACSLLIPFFWIAAGWDR